MTTANEMTYTALITITLPGAQQAQAYVTLTPPDTVDVDGRIKQLSDCTLAELQAAADQLEAAVWETYQAINLVDLDADETAVVEVTVLNPAGEPLRDLQQWRRQLVVLPGEPEPEEEELELEEETAVVAEDEAEMMAETAVDLEPEAEDAVEAETAATPEATLSTEETDVTGEQLAADITVTHFAEEEDPEVTVAESEPVHPEREADLAAADETVIAPSQARVRIAGHRLPVAHSTWMACDILIDEPALRACQAHALSSFDREVAGVLVGPPPEKQPDGRYLVHIIDSIIAKYTVMNGASVTYTPESWRYVNDKLSERYPEETAVMVGWYHTHPGFGIFLSGMDQFIHQNFFTQIWHVALVLDPRARTAGFFCWDRHQSRVSPVEFTWPDWAREGW